MNNFHECKHCGQRITRNQSGWHHLHLKISTKRWREKKLTGYFYPRCRNPEPKGFDYEQEK